MNYLKLILTFSLLLVSAMVLCQVQFPPAGGGEPCGGPFSDPCPIPLDGGVGFLIAAGVAYGGKKIHDMKRRSK